MHVALLLRLLVDARRRLIEHEALVRRVAFADVRVPSGHVTSTGRLAALAEPKCASAGSCDTKLLPARSSRICDVPPAVTRTRAPMPSVLGARPRSTTSSQWPRVAAVVAVEPRRASLLWR